MTANADNLIPGAEPTTWDGNSTGVLVLHGFTGNPNSMRHLAEAIAAQGYTVELPLLPGHGTVVEDMIKTGWKDWSSHAEIVYQSLAQRCEKVVVVGLSMGGALTAWLGSRHHGIAGLVFINALVSEPEGMRAIVEELIDSGEDRIAGIGSDIADPDVVESAYSDTPLAPLATLFDAADELANGLKSIASPVLIFTSPQDHVVAPVNSDLLAESVTGSVERILCERSYHVATMDYDKDLIVQATIDFIAKVTADI